MCVSEVQAVAIRDNPLPTIVPMAEANRHATLCSLLWNLVIELVIASGWHGTLALSAHTALNTGKLWSSAGVHSDGNYG